MTDRPSDHDDEVPPRSLWDQVPDAEPSDGALPWGSRRPGEGGVGGGQADRPTQAVPPVPPVPPRAPSPPGPAMATPAATGAGAVPARPSAGRYREPSFARRNPGVVAGLAAVVALALGLLAGWALTSAAEDEPAAEPAVDPQVAALQGELDAALAAQEEVAGQLQALEAANAELQQQAAAGQTTAAELQASLDALTAERDQALADLAASQEVVATLEDSLAAIDDAFAFTESLVGTQLAAAEDWAENRGLRLVTNEVPAPDGDDVDEGTVLTQAPDPGTPLLPGSVVYVEVVGPAEEGE